jgi:hypothetical protein
MTAGGGRDGACDAAAGSPPVTMASKFCSNRRISSWTARSKSNSTGTPATSRGGGGWYWGSRAPDVGDTILGGGRSCRMAVGVEEEMEPSLFFGARQKSTDTQI